MADNLGKIEKWILIGGAFAAIFVACGMAISEFCEMLILQPF